MIMNKHILVYTWIWPSIKSNNEVQAQSIDTMVTIVDEDFRPFPLLDSRLNSCVFSGYNLGTVANEILRFRARTYVDLAIMGSRGLGSMKMRVGARKENLELEGYPQTSKYNLHTVLVYMHTIGKKRS